MNKSIGRLAAAMCAALLAAAPALATDDGYYPKNEMRAAWMAALGIDFPLSGRGTSDGTIDKQKKEIVKYLDNMKAAGLNCVFFHVRPMSDRLYKKNSYNGVTVDEPFSHYITGTRGVEPNYDPLQVWIDEAHARGMELHAWINPYRYNNYTASSIPSATFNPYSTEHDIEVFNSGWIIKSSYTHDNGATYTTNYIYNPAEERSIQLVSDVCYVLCGNYDLDGIVFDDYFYPDGIAKNSTAPDYHNYQDYLNGGGTMSFLDWRRDNANRMIASVYSTIKSVKPWVRFGVSPAGAAGKGLLDTDGLPPLSQYCSAGDWQYDNIASDPMAWLRNKSLDYISPQIYWATTHSTNPFGPMTDWWTLVANKFGRHVYVSNYISAIANNNNDSYRAELSKQITLQRQYTEQNGGECGIVFFSAKYVDGYYTIYKLENYFKEHNFSREALLPAMTWQAPENPGLVQNLAKEGSKLTWDAMDNMRYSVYAVPASVAQENFDYDSEYLLGFTYNNEFDLGESASDDMQYAVCAYDRAGYEYSARFVGAQTKALASPTLLSPESGVPTETPFSFKWEAVEGATSYVIEIALNDNMKTDFVCAKTLNTTEISSSELPGLPANEPIYWRVRACAPNSAEGVSATSMASITRLAITAPYANSTDVPLSPTITWNNPTREVTLQVASNNTFAATSIVIDTKLTGGSYTVPTYYLAGGTKYYARLSYEKDGETHTTEAVPFTTVVVEPVTTTLSHPTDGGVLHSDEHIAINPVEGVRMIRLEVSADQSFPSRTSYINSTISTKDWTDPKEAGQIKISSKNLVDGNTYYARVKLSFTTASGTTTDAGYSETISFTYNASTGVKATESDADGIFSVNYADKSHPVITVNRADKAVRISVVDMAAREVAVLHDGTIASGTTFKTSLTPGIYLVVYAGKSGSTATKIIVK